MSGIRSHPKIISQRFYNYVDIIAYIIGALMSLLIVRTKFSDFSDDGINAKNSTRTYM